MTCECANVVPARTVKLCEFLREAKRELFVKEAGTGIWWARLSPPLDHDMVFGIAEAKGRGWTADEALEDLYRELSEVELLGSKTGWFRRTTYNHLNVKVVP